VNNKLNKLRSKLEALPDNAWTKVARAAGDDLIALHDSTDTIEKKRERVAEIRRAWIPATKHKMATDACLILFEMMQIVESEKQTGTSDKKTWWRFWA
jgi:hypothetical protein